MTKEEFFKIYYNCTPKDFDWTNNSDMLCLFCSHYLYVWWGPELFNWRYSYRLAINCTKDFKLWWDFKKYDRDDISELFDYCLEYRDIWEPDLLLRRIL